ncbi:MAG: DegT/DnrJ/EryC1/StrS aminotransferase family protein [Gammaproteobacteria bacterium]
MSEQFLPFSKPCIDQATIDEVVECLRSGWLATGPRVKRFESDLAKYFKKEVSNTLVLTSATAGLQLALQSLNFQPGDEVITTSITFAASANTIVQAGAKPVFVDVELETRNIDIRKVEKAITAKTKAILPVHFAGVPVDLDAVYALAKKYNLRVIEDAAHAVGSFYKDKIIGSFGDTQVFSFHPNKVMTSGEGGAVTTSDANMAKFISVMRFHGIDREAWNRNAKEGSQHYDVIAAGYKYNMMDIQAALGIHQLAHLEEFIAKRTKLALRYNELFAGWEELMLPQNPDYSSRNSWYIYAPLINIEKAKITRDEFMQKMKEQNIGTGLHYEAVHLYSFYQKTYGYKRGDFSNAEIISDRIVSLPLFPDMTFADQDRVVTAMRKIFKG